MRLYYDLHIHSALSPCCDDEMTPNNIVNMAYLKELDVISVTDHNSLLNIEPIIDLATKLNIIVIPGMEITTKEDIHILSYFKNVKDAFDFYDEFSKSIPFIKNNENIFGNQLVLDKFDKVIYKEKKLLLTSSKLSINEIFKLIRKYNGIGVPAHINKSANSIIANLGFMPPELNIKLVEINNNTSNFDFIKYNNFDVLINSDAHFLKDISEPIHFIEANDKTLENVFNALNLGGNIQ